MGRKLKFWMRVE